MLRAGPQVWGGPKALLSLLVLLVKRAASRSLHKAQRVETATVSSISTPLHKPRVIDPTMPIQKLASLDRYCTSLGIGTRLYEPTNRKLIPQASHTGLFIQEPIA